MLLNFLLSPHRRIAALLTKGIVRLLWRRRFLVCLRHRICLPEISYSDERSILRTPTSDNHRRAWLAGWYTVHKRTRSAQLMTTWRRSAARQPVVVSCLACHSTLISWRRQSYPRIMTVAKEPLVRRETPRDWTVLLIWGCGARHRSVDRNVDELVTKGGYNRGAECSTP